MPWDDRDQGQMLPLGKSIHFDDRRRDEADADLRLRIGLAAKPPVLCRSTINIIALGGILAIIYGMLVPFNFHRHHLLSWCLPITSVQPGDSITNIIIYVPMGMFLRLLFRRRGSWRIVEYAVSLLLAGGISYVTEVLQALVPARVPSLTDTAFNVFGAGIGATLAPVFQQCLRRWHAWVYGALQITPFAVAASVMTVCVCVYALAPFDLRPTPGHVLAAIERVWASWQVGLGGGYNLAVTACMGKCVAAAAYGLLAFLLTVAGRETNRSVVGSGWYGLSRACSLVVAIEAVQLFTVSHAADWRDVEIGWVFSAIGTSAAMVLLWLRPLIYQDPVALIGPVVPLALLIFAGWCAVAGLHASHACGGGSFAWMPIMAGFHRSWDTLLAEYAALFVNYALAAGLLTLWFRMRQRSPGLWGCIAGAMVPAIVRQILAVVVYGGVGDMSHLVLAGMAGWLMHRIDRAVCGRRNYDSDDEPACRAGVVRP